MSQAIEAVFKELHCEMTFQSIKSLLASSPYHCFFVKDRNSNYHYANDNFIKLMGLDSLRQLKRLSDTEMSQSKKDAKKYRELDCQIIEEGMSLSVSEIITPELNRPIIKTMTGFLFPGFKEEEKANFVIGLVSPESKLLKLDWDSVFSLSINELKSLLIKKCYHIKLTSFSTTISRMEILILVELLKGKHAGHISQALHIRQATVESYLANIKDKFGVNQKVELINIVISENIFQQIIL